MEKKILQFAVLAFVLFTQNTFAQDLYMPRNIREAYANGTRSKDGKPGKNYWQNRGKYTMEIAVDPKTRLVSGTETIVYQNNSSCRL